MKCKCYTFHWKFAIVQWRVSKKSVEVSRKSAESQQKVSRSQLRVSLTERYPLFFTSSLSPQGPSPWMPKKTKRNDRRKGAGRKGHGKKRKRGKKSHKVPRKKKAGKFRKLNRVLGSAATSLSEEESNRYNIKTSFKTSRMCWWSTNSVTALTSGFYRLLLTSTY